VRVTRAAPPIFLDRDGTLIVEKHYLSDPREVSLEAGVASGLAALTRHGYPLVVVTNQSGIGRGMFSDSDAKRVNARVAELLAKCGIAVTAWYICPHAPEDLCICRKPAPGMAFAAARDLGFDLAGCYVVGDKRGDLELADAIGGEGILVMTGHGASAAPWAREHDRPVVADMGHAAEFILARERQRRADS